MELSVVIVNWNGRDHIGHCLASIAGAVLELQTEIVVVDNQSTDSSVDLVREDFPQAKIIQGQANVGFGRGAQSGVEAAQGEFIAIVNPDVVLGPGSLSQLVDLLQEHPAAAWTGPKTVCPNGQVQSGAYKLGTAFWPLLWFPGVFRLTALLRSKARDIPRRCQMLDGACMVFRASMLKAAGGMPTSTFMYGEEQILGARFRRLHYEIWYNPLSTVFHDLGSSSRQKWTPDSTVVARQVGLTQAMRETLGYPRFLVYNSLLFLSLLIRLFGGLVGHGLRPGLAFRLMRLCIAAFAHTERQATSLRSACRRARAVLADEGVAGLVARSLVRLMTPKAPPASDWVGEPVPLAQLGDERPAGGARTAAVFVAYFPDEQFRHRVAATIEQVDRVYVVDNTPTGDSLRLDLDVDLITNGRNLGVATALNQGARRAIAGGGDFLLMMDQDSAPREGMVAALQTGLSRWPAPTAIASPVHIDPNVPADSDYLKEKGCVRSMLTTMTAGSLLDLRAYEALGPFRDDLFIDQVDHEYCLRAHRAGCDVVQVGDALIDHALGSKLRRRFGKAEIVTTDHTAVRRYYMTRNRLLVAREYREVPQYWRRERYLMLVGLRDTIFFKGRRVAKLWMTTRGAWDYRRGRTGPMGGGSAWRHV